MKIPETSANVGAYYGNEESGQWQPNGVMIDTGVGGGIVGSGDAGIHRPQHYPPHLARGHMPGYVVAGPYYSPAYPPGVQGPAVPTPNDFSDYMWMENEEEFDKQVMQQLEEEALMEQCIEAMLDDEQRERRVRPTANGHGHAYPTTSNGNPSVSLEEAVSRSTLNPLAAEFVPTFVKRKPPTAVVEEKPQSAEAPPVSQKEAEDDSTPSSPSSVDESVDSKTEESPTHTDPPEVSAADVQPIEKSQRLKDKKLIKQEPKKTKPLVVKSDTKVLPAKKSEVKSNKSEAALEEKAKEVKRIEAPADTPKPQPISQTPSEETAGPKPINYAAAARANKPKKPTTPPVVEKPAPHPPVGQKKTEKAPIKKAMKDIKPVQRKNSTK